jgi:hypothetical protein
MTHKEERPHWPAVKCVLIMCFGVALLLGSLSQPLTVTGAEVKGETGLALPEYYPDRFDGTGRIDRITVDEIVIDDTLYRFSRNAEFATPTRRHALKAWFRVGDHVGFLINAKYEIISLWLIE